MEWVNIDLTIPKRLRIRMLKDLIWNIKQMKINYTWAFKIWFKYIKLRWMLRDEV